MLHSRILIDTARIAGTDELEYEAAYGGQDLFAHSPGSERIVFGDVLPNVGDVLCRFRMKTKAQVEAHRGVR